MQDTVPAEAGRLSNWLCLGYGTGMVGGQIFRDAPALLLLFFMTDTLEIPAAMAGIAIFVPKIWVVFADPLAGIASDRVNTRWGRRRPFVLFGGLLTAACFILLFHVPHFETAFARSAYVSATYTLALTGFALFSVPYLTMGSEMTTDFHERTKLMAFRVVFMGVGLIVSGYAGAIRDFGGQGEAGYSFMAWTVGVVCLLAILVTFFSTANAPFSSRHETTLTLKQQLLLALENQPFLMLLAASFLQKLSEGIGYATVVYFLVYVLQQSFALIGTILMFGAVGAIVAQPFWVAVSKRLGKMPTFYLGLFIYSGLYSCWLLMEPDRPGLILTLAFVAGFFNGSFLLVALSMLTDAITHDRLRTGLNREGAYSGVWMANEKVAFALGTLIVGLILGWFGFIESAGDQQVAQPEGALTGISFSFVMLPLLFNLSSMVFLRRYKLSEADLAPGA